jgi:hypothetical protein
MQREEQRSAVSLPYADPEDAPEEVATWAIDLLLSEGEKTELPPDILDCLSALPTVEAARDQLEAYKAFEAELPDVMWSDKTAITEDYEVELAPWLEPGSAEAKLWLAQVDKLWQVKQRSCYIMVIRYCIICGKPECPIRPVEVKIRIEARD